VSGAPAARPIATAGDALDRSDRSRMRAFYTFGSFAPFGAIALSLVLGGDPVARIAFWLGACLLAVCNIALIAVTRRETVQPSRWVDVLWPLSSIGLLPS